MSIFGGGGGGSKGQEFANPFAVSGPGGQPAGAPSAPPNPPMYGSQSAKKKPQQQATQSFTSAQVGSLPSAQPQKTLLGTGG